MKIRNGFVSNSSSSSFLVAFDNNAIPTTEQEMHKLLFGSTQDHPVTEYDYEASSMEMARKALYDLQKQKKPLTFDQVLEEIRSGYFEGCIGTWDYEKHSETGSKMYELEQQYREKYKTEKDWIHSGKHPDDSLCIEYRKLRDKLYDEVKKINDETARKIAQKFWDDTMDPIGWELERISKEVAEKFAQKVYVFSYSDNNGSFGCLMEHWGIFNRLNHVTISHH